MHCRARPAATKDHWLPESWYPDGFAEDVEKSSFPSCSPCNNELGKVEDRLRARLALGLDPSSPAAQGIVPSVWRSMDPGAGRDEKDSALRSARLEKLKREVLPAAAVPSYSILPGLGPEPNAPEEDLVATLISPTDLEAFVVKLVRGLTFLQLGRAIESTHEIHMQLLAPEDAWILNDALDKVGETIDKSPAIVARVARAKEDPVSAIYEFRIWDKLAVHAVVRPRSTPA